VDKLPKAARDYMDFIERETKARVGMISTGPDRDQTMFVDEFLGQLKETAGSQAKHT